jgi:hypothetical protein
MGYPEHADACWLIFTAVRKSIWEAARIEPLLLEGGVLLVGVCWFSVERLVEWYRCGGE